MGKRTPTLKLFAPAYYGIQPGCFHDYSPTKIRVILNGLGGCGPGAGIGDKLVPDKFLGISVKAACAIHDWMCKFGIREKDRERADNIFLNNMNRIIDFQTYKRVWWMPNILGIKLFKKLQGKRRLVARGYYFVVKYGGGPFYWKDKNEFNEIKPVKI